MSAKQGFIIAAGMMLMSSSAMASESWQEIKPQIFGDRLVEVSADSGVALQVPYRSPNDPRTDVTIDASFPDGRMVQSVTLIIDENPVPVSAVFDLETPQPSFETTVTMRMNGPSDVRAVIEADDGSLHMASAFVKTSGVGACAAPPTTGMEEAIAKLGRMELDTGEQHVASVIDDNEGQKATLSISHPQYSGMQMDQITLLYIQAHYIDTVEVWSDDEKLYTMTGSISLSEDPAISFGYPVDSGIIRVKVKDTEGEIFERGFLLGGA